MRGTGPEERESPPARPLEVLTGSEAVARVERAICADAVARDPAVAEGLALAGVRAASLGDGVPSPSSPIVLREASCVHHVDGIPAREQGAAFELAASSAQEAVDQSLVAHLLSRRLGRPGICSLSPALASHLCLVEVPRPERIALLLDDGAKTAESSAAPSRVVELAGEAFRAAAERIGRAGDVVRYQGKGGEAIVVVASGEDASAAREAATAISGFGVLSVSLVRPFPESAVREALASAQTVLVLESPAAAGALLASVRACVDPKVDLHALSPGPPAQLLEALGAHLPEAFDPGRHVPLAATLGQRLVVAPSGPWGETTARQAAAALAELGPLQLAPRVRHHLASTVLSLGSEAISDSGPDVLLALHPALLERSGPLGLIRPEGRVIVISSANSSLDLASTLDPDTRGWIAERKLRVHWVEAPEAEGVDLSDESDHAVGMTLVGALLAALSGPVGADVADRVAGGLTGAGRTDSARWLRDGARGLQTLESAALEPARHVEEVDFRPSLKLPRMPEPEEDPEERDRWAKRILRFYRTGKGAFSPAPHLMAHPALLRTLAEAQPFVLVRGDEPGRPIAARVLREVLGEAIESLPDSAPSARILADNLDRLTALAAQLLSRRVGSTEVAPLVAAAGSRLVDQFGLKEDQKQPFVEHMDQLVRNLPERGLVLDLRADTGLQLYRAVVDAVRGPQRQRFRGDLVQLRERLSDLLEIDRASSPEGRQPESVAATLGGSATEFLDPEALVRTVSRTSGSKGMDAERRARVEAALAVITDRLEGDEPLPPPILLRPPGIAVPARGLEQQEHVDPLAASIGVFDGVARRMTSLFRAMRIARLEVAGTYRPELHDEVLAHLDPEGLTAQELRLLPPVVVVTTGARLRHRDQRSLSELLRSSRPVHVIVQDQVTALDEARDLSRFHLDLGTLVMAHREAFVVASTLSRPDLLTDGLVRMVSALRPGVALVHLPAMSTTVGRGLLAQAALEGRACPEFRYDPDAGSSWADRFDLGGNPQPESAWPVHPMRFIEGGGEQVAEMAFTFADAVAVDPTYLRHLRIIPRVAWDETQLPLAEYLERFDPEGRERSIPYLWVLDEAGTLQRAGVTRELAMVCADRLRAWRVLQELGGHRNVFAERAATAAREQALEEAERERAALEKSHTDNLERVRTDTAKESMERLAAALLSPDELASLPSELTAAFPSVEMPPAEVPLESGEAAPVEPTPVVQEVEEEPLSFDEPFIDTPLCTTCNECTNLNSRLFQYNADKQAIIADSTAGTFAELVKAAELCPARCIHPGKPRGDDSTGTAEMIERAAPFNE
jgi:ferredoxin